MVSSVSAERWVERSNIFARRLRSNFLKLETLTLYPFAPQQGCQMVYFQTKNSNLGILFKALEWNIFVHYMTIWSI
jgi:hypothetical protein